MLNYAITIRDKVAEDETAMKQIANNAPEQAMLGDFTTRTEDAIFASSEAHNNQQMQLLPDPAKFNQFVRVVFEMLKRISN
ncbi:hypothetical protein [Vitreoscilla stercoraria]|uniref:Uncharacterized protein n=1 Tax=Vitreoscilla stercoraria TaxID=61 RepID=A0ABY4EJ38_VITST|nr:hypothetical protein [Vitreoscilla stercoraria]UOO93387.1 hypothetical protein LVJ81_04990 [Vitreoscilla stercoraria]